SRIPTAVLAPITAARAQARSAGGIHAAFPAVIQESPTVALAALACSDLVIPVTPAIAGPALRSGQVVVLPWRAPWLSVHPGIVRLRNRVPDEAEATFLDLLRDVDCEEDQAARALCERLGISADCDA